MLVVTAVTPDASGSAPVTVHNRPQQSPPDASDALQQAAPDLGRSHPCPCHAMSGVELALSAMGARGSAKARVLQQLEQLLSVVAASAAPPTGGSVLGPSLRVLVKKGLSERSRLRVMDPLQHLSPLAVPTAPGPAPEQLAGFVV